MVSANELDESCLSELFIYFSVYLLLVMTYLSTLQFLLMLLPDLGLLSMGFHSSQWLFLLVQYSSILPVCKISLFKQAYFANGCLGIDNKIVGGVI